MEQRLYALKAQLNTLKLDAMLIASPINRRYLTGFTGTAGVVVISEHETVFITDFRYEVQAAQQIEGCRIDIHTGPISEKIAELLKELKVKRLGFEQDHVTYSEYLLYEKRFSDVQLIPVSYVVEKLRMIKTDEELERIRDAVKVVDQTFTHILSFIKPGMKEIEVAIELEFYMRKLGAASSSFDIIVASGARSALPHGVASQKVIETGDFVTLDFGAYMNGYCSDMTRTFSIGEPAQELKDIYNICLEAQLAGVQNIKAGMTGKEADACCRDIIEQKGYGDYFGHSTGHGLGMEIHESPRLSKTYEEALLPGMVVTVEPGIYLPGKGGVRIEDDIVITQTGNHILTQSSKELIIL